MSQSTRRRHTAAGAAVALALAALAVAASAAEPPYQATGIKIGEVTPTSAIVWTRLTRNPQRNPADAPMVKFRYEEKPGRKRRIAFRLKVLELIYPEGMTAADIRDAAPGAPGEVRVALKSRRQQSWRFTPWQAVDPDRDFTRQFPLKGLKPGAEHLVRVECRKDAGSAPGQTVEGRFVTAPPPDAPARVVFTVSTGQGYGSRDCPEGYKIYPQMLRLQPSFFAHTGDIVYYDRLAKSLALARYHWQRTYSLPTNVAFHRQVASYFVKDDHDTWQDDCYPTMTRQNMGTFTFAQGLAVFREQVPMGERTYRTCRWGSDLQVWLVEGRDFRSGNREPDGPDKTIWGAEQKAWFKRTVKASDATFRVLISPTPLVGPDRPTKADNHSNKAFAHEGRELRRFIAAQKHMAVVCGDRHWQYVSVDPDSGCREYSCGPVSHKHAGGWRQTDFVKTHHRYLKVCGGFLAGTVERLDGVPTLTFRHYDPDGKLLHEDRLRAE